MYAYISDETKENSAVIANHNDKDSPRSCMYLAHTGQRHAFLTAFANHRLKMKSFWIFSILGLVSTQRSYFLCGTLLHLYLSFQYYEYFESNLKRLDSAKTF